MKRILYTLIILLALSLLISGDEFKDAWKERNIKKCLELLEKGDEKQKEKMLKTAFENRKRSGKIEYELFLRYIRENPKLLEKYEELLRGNIITEMEFLYISDYFEIRDFNDLYAFIGRHQKDSLDYYKYAKVYMTKGKLRDMMPYLMKGEEMYLYSSVIMFSITDSISYLSGMSGYVLDSAKKAYDRVPMTWEQKCTFMKVLDYSKGTGPFTNDLVRMAIYKRNEDFSQAFAKTDLKESYERMKNFGEFEADEEKNIGNYLDAAAEIFSGNSTKKLDEFLLSRKGEELSIYLKGLQMLFSSQYQVSKESARTFFVTSKSRDARLEVLKLVIAGSYIEDGSILRKLFIGERGQLGTLLYITGKDTPVYYTYLLEEGEFEKAEDVKKSFGDDKVKLSYAVIEDILRGRINKSEAETFMKQFPDYPISGLLRSIIYE